MGVRFCYRGSRGVSSAVLTVAVDLCEAMRG